MGVGNYRVNSSSGVSFTIYGPLAREEDYQSYCQEAEEPLGYDDWAAMEHDARVQLLKDTIATVRDLVGLADPNSNERFCADPKLQAMSHGMFEIGFGGWEHDHVIAVAPEVVLAELLEDNEDFNEEEYSRRPDALQNRLFSKYLAAEQLVESYGMPASDVDKLVMQVVNDLKKLLIISLQDEGLVCSYPTSAWSSASYEALSPADSAQTKEALVKSIKAARDQLAAPAATVMKTISVEQRHELLKMADRSRLSSYKPDLQKLHILVPYAIRNEEKVYINHYDLMTDRVLCSTHVPDSLQGKLTELMSDREVVAINESSGLEEWWVALRAKGLAQPLKYNENYLFASAEEVASVWKDDVVMDYTDDDGVAIYVMLAEHASPAATARPVGDSPSP